MKLQLSIDIFFDTVTASLYPGYLAVHICVHYLNFNLVI